MNEERRPEADGDEAEGETEWEIDAEGETEWEIDAEGRNPTQQRMDEEGVEEAPVDASWEGENGPEVTEAAETAEDDAEPTFEPDVPLVAEVNREAGEASDRKRRLGALGAAGALLVGVVLRRRRRRRR
jgi:hypothetical protein